MIINGTYLEISRLVDVVHCPEDINFKCKHGNCLKCSLNFYKIDDIKIEYID